MVILVIIALMTIPSHNEIRIMIILITIMLIMISIIKTAIRILS